MTRTGVVISTSVALLAGAALVASCNAPGPVACPGERVATLQFQGELESTDASCAFAADASVAFGAAVTYAGDGGAALCVDRPEAQPLVGTEDGGHVVLSSPVAPASVASCACAVYVTETVEGDLQRDGAVVTFVGELRDEIAPAPGTDPATCQLADGGSCGAPCELRWQLTGSP